MPPDVAPNEAWDYYYRRQDRMDLLLVAASTNFKVASVVPQELYALQLRCTAGDAGQLGLGEVFDQWRTWLRCMAAESSFQCSSSRVSSLGLPGRDPGQPGDEKEHAHIERSVVGWRGKAQAHCNSAQPALIAEILQGAFAGRAAWECVVPALLGGSHADFVEDVRRCCSKVDIMTEEDPLKSPQHLFALRTLAILLGCSAMASGGKGYYAAQAAASPSSGGDRAPGWRAADSLLMIAAQRARQWRESEGLLEDNDFAYAYTDYDRVGRSSCRR